VHAERVADADNRGSEPAMEESAAPRDGAGGFFAFVRLSPLNSGRGSGREVISGALRGVVVSVSF
jgi:hypothetical protein